MTLEIFAPSFPDPPPMHAAAPRVHRSPCAALWFALVVLVAGDIGHCRADDPVASTTAIDPEAVRNLDAAYPKATGGRVRHVILLPHRERGEEDDFKVEIVAGRTIDTDGVNTVRFGGEFREKEIPGWGFSFFEVDALPGPLSTRIAPPPGTPSEKRFVAGPKLLVAYNSRLPLVVYAPEGVEILSRVWRADGEPVAADRR